MLGRTKALEVLILYSIITVKSKNKKGIDITVGINSMLPNTCNNILCVVSADKNDSFPKSKGKPGFIFENLCIL